MLADKLKGVIKSWYRGHVNFYRRKEYFQRMDGGIGGARCDEMNRGRNGFLD